MSEERAPNNLALVRDGMGQGGIDEGLKLSKGLRVGSLEVPAGDGDIWLENSIRYSTAISAGGTDQVGTIVYASAWTPLTIITKAWDTDEIIDLARSYTQLLIKTGGIYSMFGYLQFPLSAVGIRGIGIMLNGTTLLGVHQMPAMSATPTYMTINVTWELVESDYIELVAYQTTPGVLVLEYGAVSVTRLP